MHHGTRHSAYDTRRSVRAALGTIMAVLALAAWAIGPAVGATAPADTGQAFAEHMTACLRAEGWSVSTRPDGAVESSIPAEWRTRYQDDLDQCAKQFGYGQPAAPAAGQLSPRWAGSPAWSVVALIITLAAGWVSQSLVVGPAAVLEAQPYTGEENPSEARSGGEVA